MHKSYDLPTKSISVANSIAKDEINPQVSKSSDQPNVLLLTTSLLIDRMVLYTDLLPRLAENSNVKVWADSYADSRYKELWLKTPVPVEEFPLVKRAPLLHTYLRRLNEFAWDYKQKPPSRISLAKHRGGEKRKDINALRPFARLIANFNLERKLEKRLERMMSSYQRSEEALRQIHDFKPSVIITTGPYQYQQPAIIPAARKLNIPILCLIPSWDNISTKNRMVFEYDGYLVWSEQQEKELKEQYAFARNKPVYVIGAPQFDVFFNESFYQTKEEFCRQQELDPELPVIVYALGSPNFLNEAPGALYLAEQIQKGELGKVQMLVRPHPLHDKGELYDLFKNYSPLVKIQRLVNKNELGAKSRSQDEKQIVDWLNTFRHADVVVNLSSTVSIDAAIFDKPVVNLDFDPQPGQSDQMLIKDINHLWTHFKPIAESGGVWLVNDYAELIEAVRTYLKDPSLHKEKRRLIAHYVCGHLDGKCGSRMADAILDFTKQMGAKSFS